MDASNKNNQITIFENDTYSLTATINPIKTPTETIISIKLNNDTFYLGNLINDNTICEWLEVNNRAVAIIGQSNSSQKQYIKMLFYIPHKSFLCSSQADLLAKFEELFGIKSNDDIQKIKYKKN